ncbi:uncharacterized protein LOC144820212 [Lissotriton helveticus]
MEAAVKHLAESQELLGKMMEKFLKTAEDDRGQLHDVLKGQGSAQDQALEKLTTVMGQQRPTTSLPSVVLQKYVPGEDPDYFFTNFERLAQAAAWPADRWGHYLGPLLTGELQAAYQQANIQGQTPYADIKTCILERLGIDDETYRVRLRQAREGPQETPRALSFRIQDLTNRWLKPATATKEDILAKIYLEQYLASLHPATQKWVRQHARLTLDSAVEIASAYSRAQETQRPKEEHPSRITPGNHPRVPRPPQVVRRPDPAPLMPYPILPRPHPPGPQCYHCGGFGHIARVCPQKEEPMDIGMARNYACLTADNTPPPFRCPVRIDGHGMMALADTGCRQSVLRPQELPHPVGPVTGNVAITCVHGDTKSYPTTQVHVQNPTDKGSLLTVGLIPNLPEQAILGSDYSGLPRLLQDTTDSLRKWWAEAPFSHELSPVNPVIRPTKTRRQKKKEKREYAMAFPAQIDVHPWETDREFRATQQEDPVLQEAWARALDAEDPLHVGPYFFRKNGLLYRKGGPQQPTQLVIPGLFREKVLFLAHSHLLGGHFSDEKTGRTILDKFYWPGVHGQIKQYCRECPVCQRNSRYRPPRVPLQPLPLIDVPFTRVGMDIIGPLLPSRTGCRYALVLVDYATRFPEAIPLRHPTTQTISKALISIFSRVGFPREILTDQGTPFVSSLMRQVCSHLGIKQIRTSAYHPQTDGLVERYNATLKATLKKLLGLESKRWEEMLPLALFAIRCKPQSSTGYSPYELLYGRAPRTLLDMAREAWEAEPDRTRPLPEYVDNLKTHLEQIRVIVRQNLVAAQNTQKHQYDKGTKARKFVPGDLVLLLLPSSDHKLLGQWQGPFPVLRVVTPVTYEIETDPTRGVTQIYHVNLLKKWEGPRPVLSSATPPPFDVCIDPDLPEQNKRELRRALFSVQPVFSSLPGHSTVVEHAIHTEPGKTVRQRPYRIPEARRAIIQEETNQMLKMGIIEPSSSSWNSPIVLVPKPDGSTRFCIDFREVNKISAFDTYPLPRVDEMVERIGKAKYISTLDLCKGYWQIPLKAADKPKTAFSTPEGLFQFKVMPFGLHGAPATFQRAMNLVLQPHTKYAGAYLDDIVIYSDSWELHLSHLKAVVTSLGNHGFTINPSKTTLAAQSVKYLGYLLGEGLIRPQDNKIKAIQAIPFPRTRKELRAFLGLLGYYRRFIPCFSQTAAPLTDLLKKTTNTEEILQHPPTLVVHAFERLKQSLITEPVLVSPDYTQTFILQTDASDQGLGAVLSQRDSTGVERPILYLSRKLFPREANYAVVEKEALAIKWAVESLRYYLEGREFELYTDHAPLEWMARNRGHNDRVLRWFLSLQPFRFKTLHRKGLQQGNADYLSRYPPPSSPTRKTARERGCGAAAAPTSAQHSPSTGVPSPAPGHLTSRTPRTPSLSRPLQVPTLEPEGPEAPARNTGSDGGSTPSNPEAIHLDPGSGRSDQSPEGRKSPEDEEEAFGATDSWQEAADSDGPRRERGAVLQDRSEDEEEDVWTEDWWRPQEEAGERPQLGRELRQGTLQGAPVPHRGDYWRNTEKQTLIPNNLAEPGPLQFLPAKHPLDSTLPPSLILTLFFCCNKTLVIALLLS